MSRARAGAAGTGERVMLGDDDWPRLQAADASSFPREDHAADGEEIAAAFARCFATADGQRVLAHLRRTAFARVFGPQASEAVLRHAEGQKQLVALILSYVRRGGGEMTVFDCARGA